MVNTIVCRRAAFLQAHAVEQYKATLEELNKHPARFNTPQYNNYPWKFRTNPRPPRVNPPVEHNKPYAPIDAARTSF